MRHFSAINIIALVALAAAGASCLDLPDGAVDKPDSTVTVPQAPRVVESAPQPKPEEAVVKAPTSITTSTTTSTTTTTTEAPMKATVNPKAPIATTTTATSTTHAPKIAEAAAPAPKELKPVEAEAAPKQAHQHAHNEVAALEPVRVAAEKQLAKARQAKSLEESHLHSKPEHLVTLAGNETLNCSGIAWTENKPEPIMQKIIAGNCTYMEIAAYLTNGKQFLALENALAASSSVCNKSLDILYNKGCVKLNFMFGVGENSVQVVAINGEYVNGSAQATFFQESNSTFKVPTGYFYKCRSDQTVNFEHESPIKLHLSNFAFEVGRNSNETRFLGTPDVCRQDSKPSGSEWVTLAVGVCLIALIAIVLVAYFVGRKRWYQRSTYEPV